MKQNSIQKYIIIEGKEKQKILESLNNQFGIKKIPGTLLKRGSEKIFLYQGNFTQKEIAEIEEIFPIERIGVYFAKEQNGEIRLSIEGVHLLQNQITKGIFELNKEQMNQWMHGSELNIKTGFKQFLIIKYQDYFLGCGKASEEKITNFIPKNRRLKFKN
jgi:NOL1/NOP2/fmu family ribosome biogenesis protein